MTLSLYIATCVWSREGFQKNPSLLSDGCGMREREAKTEGLFGKHAVE